MKDETAMAAKQTQDNAPINTSTPPISTFTKCHGLLTKRISLDANGQILKDSTECRMADGTMEVSNLTGADFANHISNLPSNQAIGLTAPANGLRSAKVQTANGSALPFGTIARTQKYFRPQKGVAWMLLDVDNKWVTPAERSRLVNGSVWDTLQYQFPGLKGCGHVRRPSTSGGLYNASKTYADSLNEHIYIMVADGTDIDRVLKVVVDRLILAGFGGLRLSAAGSLLKRSLVDAAVGSPERLVFEGQPVVEAPLGQHPRSATWVDGPILDTRVALPNLSSAERNELKDFLGNQRRELKPNAELKQETHIQKRASEIAAKSGKPVEKITEALKHWGMQKLPPVTELHFDDPDLGVKNVGDVLRDPHLYRDATLADPIDGPEMGPCRAKLYVNKNGIVLINTQTHGGGIFECVYDRELCEQRIHTTNSQIDAIKILGIALAGGLLTLEDQADLIDKVDRKGKIGKRDIKPAVLDTVRKRQTEREQSKYDDDPRVKIDLWQQQGDSSRQSVLQDVDRVFANCTDPIPPFRLATNGLLGTITQKRVAEFYTLTSEPEKGDERVSAPPVKRLTEATRLDTQLMFNDRVVLRQSTKHGFQSVDLPAADAVDYANWQDSKLPHVKGLATLPMIGRNGKMLTGPGLDRHNEIIFDIDPRLQRALQSHPIPTDTAEAIEMAKTGYLYLRDTVFKDVLFADRHKDFAAMVALLCTSLQMPQLSAKPVGAVTSNVRGTGKTTLLNAMATITTGYPAPSLSWSRNPEEREKVWDSALLANYPLIVFDNIPRGENIQGDKLDVYCYFPTVGVRPLGSSQNVEASTQSLVLFTGNAIRFAGDTSSRGLMVNLMANTQRPERRDVEHEVYNDYIHKERINILWALYAILMVPMNRNAIKNHSRFPDWYRIVAAPIEHVANLIGDVIDGNGYSVALSFDDIFEELENDDYEQHSRSVLFLALYTAYKTNEFAAGQVHRDLKTNPQLREALQSHTGLSSEEVMALSAVSVGKYLRNEKDGFAQIGEEKSLVTVKLQAKVRNKQNVYQMIPQQPKES